MSKNKILLFVVLILAVLLAACGGADPEGCLGTADDALVDLECQEITIAVENAYLPFNYVNVTTGEWLGWDYDAWDEICTRLHCTPVYTEAVWDGMILAVSDGQYDVGADGITITEDRAEIVDYSRGYIALEQRMLVRLDEDRFSSIEELAADDTLIMGTQTGTTNYETALAYVPEDRLEGYDTFPAAILSLIAGDIDAVIIDDVAGQGYMGANADEVKLTGDSISSDWLGFIYPLGSDLVEPVDKALDAMIADGFMAALNKVYFGLDFTVSYDDIGDGAYAED
jgi:polar amino acid transport system substrate-binding protein